jgi:NlpB/DapX lipoprotein
MRISRLLVCLLMAMGMGTDCQSIMKPSSQMVMGIADLPCDEVWEGVLRVLKNNKIPLLVTDKMKKTIETGPVNTLPVAGDPFQKMEEQYRIKIKCMEPLVTQITCQIKVRGLTEDNNWIELKEVSKYEKRFLDTLKFNK